MNIYHTRIFILFLLACSQLPIPAASLPSIKLLKNYSTPLRVALGYVNGGQYAELKEHISECVYSEGGEDMELFDEMIYLKDTQSTYSMNLIDCCAYAGKIEALQVIYELGVDINYRKNKKHPSIITMLLDFTPTPLSKERLTTIKKLLDMQGIDIETPCTVYGSTPLIWTAYHLSILNKESDHIHALLCKIARKLIKRKVNMLAESKRGDTAFSFLLEALDALRSSDSRKKDRIEGLIGVLIEKTSNRFTGKSLAINQSVKMQGDIRYPLFLALFSAKKYSSIHYLLDKYFTKIDFRARTSKDHSVNDWIAILPPDDKAAKKILSKIAKKQERYCYYKDYVEKIQNRQQQHFLSERAYKCPKCHKQFSSKNKWKNHMHSKY